MKQFFKILALAALALPFTGCDVEYSDINILPDPVFRTERAVHGQYHIHL